MIFCEASISSICSCKDFSSFTASTTSSFGIISSFEVSIFKGVSSITGAISLFSSVIIFEGSLLVSSIFVVTFSSFGSKGLDSIFSFSLLI